MSFNFGEILSRAWQIIWKHKVLWIFGILASCGRGGSGGSGGGGGESGVSSGPTDLPPQMERFLEWMVENVTTFIAITVALVCILWIVTIFLSTIGRIGLIRGTWQAESGTENMLFGQLFSESTPYFWRMFGLSLLVGLPILILIAIFIAALVAFGISMSQGNDASALGFAGVVPLFIGCLCLLIPVGFVVGMIVRQAENAIVLEDSAVLPSLSRGWEIFRGNLGPILVMAIILAVIAFAAGFIIAIPVLVVVFPTAIAFAFSEGQNWTPMIFAGVCLCLYIPVSLVLNGIIIAYTESAWTLTYMRLTRKPNDPDVVKPENETPPTLDDGDKTIISRSHA